MDPAGPERRRTFPIPRGDEKMVRRLAGLLRPPACVAVAALVAGCALSGSSPGGGETTGNVTLTTRGARAILQGGPESVAGSVEEVFRVLDIRLTRMSVDGEGGTVEGEAGIDQVFVEMSAAGSGRTEVDVRVQSPSGQRWDRAAARGILEEVRRWQGS